MNSKKFILLLCILFVFLFSCQLANSQEGSDFNQITRLAALAKVWGFLKYHHPEVAKGKIDWDDELKSCLDNVRFAHTKEEFNQYIQNLIKRAGDINFLNYRQLFNEVQLAPLHRWLRDETHFSWYTSLKLETLLVNPAPSENHYVDQIREGSGNTTFENEANQACGFYPDEKHRILGLFRYWNIIHYFFPYKYAIGSDWEDVLLEFIPRMSEVQTAEEYHLAVREYTARINDSHASTWSLILSEYWGNYYPPFEVRYIEKKTIVTRVFSNLLPEKNLIRIGDIIEKVDNTPIDSRRDYLAKYMGASNPDSKQRNINYYILRGSTDRLDLTLARGGKKIEVQVLRYLYETIKAEKEIPNPNLPWKIMEGNIGYIDMGRLQPEDVDTAMPSLMGTQAIIFDIRNYPNGTMYDIGFYLYKDRQPFAKFTYPILEKPGSFYFSDPYWIGPNYYKPNYYKKKVVLLADERTQSHAEFTCMSFQAAPDVITIGSRTSGADGNVSRVILPMGIYTSFSGIGVYYPDGAETQRVGIKIDIKVRPTIDGITQGRDEVLERALKFIHTGH